MPRLVVAAAVIENEGAFLLTRRQQGVHLEGVWEFPGGKCEPGESHVECLSREIREELGAAVRVGREVFTIAHRYPDRIVELHFFACRPKRSQPARHPFVWVPKADLDKYGFPAANAAIVALLRSGESCRAGA